jgi:hypothetical protein
VQKICHIEFFVKDEQLAEFKQSWRNFKKYLNTQVLIDKNVLTFILNMGAILKFHAWQHWFYF